MEEVKNAMMLFCEAGEAVAEGRPSLYEMLTADLANAMIAEGVPESRAIKAAAKANDFMLPKRSKPRKASEMLRLRDVKASDLNVFEELKAAFFRDESGHLAYYATLPEGGDAKELLTALCDVLGVKEISLYGSQRDACYSPQPYADAYYKEELYRESEDESGSGGMYVDTATLCRAMWDDVYEWCWQAIRRRCLCTFGMEDFPQQLMAMREYECQSGHDVTPGMAYGLRKMYVQAYAMFSSPEAFAFTETRGCRDDLSAEHEEYAKAIRVLMGIGIDDEMTREDMDYVLSLIGADSADLVDQWRCVMVESIPSVEDLFDACGDAESIWDEVCEEIYN